MSGKALCLDELCMEWVLSEGFCPDRVFLSAHRLRLVPWLSLMFPLVPLLILTINSVFPVLTFSPLLSIPICQPNQLLCISSSVPVTTARSSANCNSHGSPHLNYSLMTSSTTINRNGLSPDPWYRPTLM